MYPPAICHQFLPHLSQSYIPGHLFIISQLNFDREVDNATKVGLFCLDLFYAESWKWQIWRHPMTALAPHPLFVSPCLAGLCPGTPAL